MIIIAGATGFLGRYLCPFMVKQGFDILALGRSSQVQEFFEERSVPFQHFDFNDEASYRALPTRGVDCVINLAAILAEIETPVSDMFQVNAVGTYHLLEYCRQNNVPRFVLASSHKVYNDIQHIPIRTTDYPCFTGDHTPYIISKIAAENFAQYYDKDFGIRGIILRLTGVHGYGEILGHLQANGDYRKSTFEIFVEKAMRGEPLEVWGDCKAIRDHIYVKDVLTVIARSVTSDSARGIYNVATGVGASLLQEAEAVVNAFSPPDKKSPIVRVPNKEAFSRSYVYDIERTKCDLDWAPQFSLTEMLLDYKQELARHEYHHYHHIKEGQRPATL